MPYLPLSITRFFRTKRIFTWYFRVVSSNDKTCCNEENENRASLSARKKKLSTRGERNFSLEFTFSDSVKLPKTRGPWKKRESAAAGWLSNFFPKTHVPQSKTLLYSKPMSVVSCVSKAKTTSFAQEPRKKVQRNENSVVDLFSKQTCTW